ncbi:MAG: Lrp/AsnC family transcriptional regulator [bacterium]
MKLDNFDLRLVKALQQDSRLTGQALAEKVGLSPSQCTRRRQQLEAQGFIAGYKAVLSPEMAGIDIFAYIHVTMDKHTNDTAEKFHKFIRTSPYILEAYKLTGGSDYLLKVAAEDLKDFNQLTNQIQSLPGLARLESQIVLDRLKSHTPLPLE